MDIIEVAKRMNHRINALTKARAEIETLAINKARTIAEYDKQLSLEILKLKSEENTPVTIIDRIARGKCWELKLEMEKAEALYKAHITNMNALEAELNGYQSINKYLKEDV